MSIFKDPLSKLITDHPELIVSLAAFVKDQPTKKSPTWQEKDQAFDFLRNSDRKLRTRGDIILDK